MPLKVKKFIFIKSNLFVLNLLNCPENDFYFQKSLTHHNLTEKLSKSLNPMKSATIFWRLKRPDTEQFSRKSSSGGGVGFNGGRVGATYCSKKIQ